MNIFVNGFNANSGGGLSVLKNFLRCALNEKSNKKYIVLVAPAFPVSEFVSDKMQFVKLPKFFYKSYLYPIVNKILIPRMVEKNKTNVIMNMSDIPIPIDGYRQVFVFDWPYAIYPESSVWKGMRLKDVWHKKYKIMLFNRYKKYVSVFAAQTDVAKNRLFKLYGLSNVVVVGNAVSLDHLNLLNEGNFDFGSGFKLLCLSKYYPHKNIESLAHLAIKIKKSAIPIKIIITISAEDHAGARELLKYISDNSIDDIIINVGTVDMNDVPALFSSCDAMILPTLLESFSGTYVEAFFHGKPVFTSDYDFARAVCGDCAVYFDPLNIDSIFDSLVKVFQDRNKLETLVDGGKDVLKKLDTWDGVFVKYTKLFDEMAKV